MTHHGYQTLLATVALSAGLLAYGATTVSADDARTVTTQGTVKIMQTDTKPDILNPLAPQTKTPGTFAGVDNTTHAGGEGLTLDYVSRFNFGPLKLDAVNDAVAYAEADQWVTKDGKKTAAPNHIQVTDKRLGRDRWKVSLKATDLKSEEKDQAGKVTKTVVLPNAAISLLESSVIDGLAKDASARFGLNKAIKVYTGDAQAVDILSVSDGQTAKGTFMDLFNQKQADKGVALTVPAKSYATEGLKSGDFSTTLTWTLTSAPL
ncbi:WxL domain-containing protein [Lacticaseibacillus rhamnosus]|uniref:WxL domain-containing protein n=1 Tax=Lacticaseibacillus rhamnosus TaxID=47715 RepID=UPI0022E51780|nr:WxL domain-containing protein [Lacticaseibacillus rhamnosus]